MPPGSGYQSDVSGLILLINMPPYRSVSTIDRAICSVQSQGVPAWDLFEIDDAS